MKKNDLREYSLKKSITVDIILAALTIFASFIIPLVALLSIYYVDFVFYVLFCILFVGYQLTYGWIAYKLLTKLKQLKNEEK